MRYCGSCNVNYCEMVEEITVDDIQIGGTADIRWKRGKAEEIYPAVLQRSRNKDGVIQYR